MGETLIWFSFLHEEPGLYTPHCALPVAPVSLIPTQIINFVQLHKAQSDIRGVWLRGLNPAPKLDPAYLSFLKITIQMQDLWETSVLLVENLGKTL